MNVRWCISVIFDILHFYTTGCAIIHYITRRENRWCATVSPSGLFPTKTTARRTSPRIVLVWRSSLPPTSSERWPSLADSFASSGSTTSSSPAPWRPTSALATVRLVGLRALAPPSGCYGIGRAILPFATVKCQFLVILIIGLLNQHGLSRIWEMWFCS